MVHPRPPPFTCTVHLEDLRSCFANLPNSLGQVILRRNAPLQNSVIELTWTDKKTERHAYVTWSGSPSGLKSGLNNGRYDKGDVIELDVAFAKANNISHGQLVTLKVMKDIKEAEYVNVEPADENDYEIVDSRQSFIESNLLKQLLVVYSGEIVPIRVNSNLVHISIGDLTPSSKYAKISSNTQVIVKPILRSSYTSTSSANGSHLPNSVRNYGLRILPQGFLSNDDGPYTIHVSTTDYPNLPLMHNNLAQISKVPQPQYNARQDHEEKNDGEAGTVGIGSLCVVVKGNAKVPTGHVYVTDVIRENIDLETFGIL
ncbi:10581_t:CDS:2, partial [Paraglomus occultum]